MTHDLEDLKSGKLIGTKRLKLACGLKEFPEEIYTLADTLEILDLSDNQFSELPENFIKLKHLKILFFARNNFTVFPPILAKFKNLNMIGFKSNQLKTVPENAFPPKLNWLILTDNQIDKLPKSIGDAHLLQKCALSGNRIEELPDEMAKCTNLELLRISANQLQAIPDWLFELPKLSWIAFSGNPVSHHIQFEDDLTAFDWNEFEVEELIGEGASGFISKANWNTKNRPVAVKVFKGDVTSDGLPEDEMEVSIAAGSHQNLIPVLGKIKNHSEGKSALIMELISTSYINLGYPPSMETCTRDVFEEDVTYNGDELLKMAKGMASVCAQLHAKGINHGDLYAHNILIDEKAESFLGDFGAASFYNKESNLAAKIERVEVRAFGCLIEDILGLIPEHKISIDWRKEWQALIVACSLPNVQSRPNFEEIEKKLAQFEYKK
ncbi:leucine-rich repeat-containing protein kinase family protein [Crocinitomix catalasitica]|uniref:leucine-rich repeat-containing protein kinase family protein n=1 Tax=Crocinitomix catalasitica TaxID=184607 RepID=UPI0004821230|nr:leucine-rich repeat-containing protein kinase family protein [Crocinitomix catalasitica]